MSACACAFLAGSLSVVVSVLPQAESTAVFQAVVSLPDAATVVLVTGEENEECLIKLCVLGVWVSLVFSSQCVSHVL